VSVHQPPLDSTPCDRLDLTPDLSCANSTQAHWVDADHQATDRAGGARARREPRRLLPVAGGSQRTPGPATGSGPTGRRAPPGPGPDPDSTVATDCTVVLRPSNATSRESLRRPCCGARSLHQQRAMAGSSCHAQPRSGCCSGGSLVRPVEPDLGALTGPHPDGGEVARRKRRPGRALDAGGGSGGALGWATALPLGVLLAVASDALSDRKAEGSNPSSDSKAAGICLSGKTSIFRSNRQWQPQHLN
jgi:hypothetical protein